jgi:hypothetical protein
MEYADRFDIPHIGMCAYCWEFEDIALRVTQVPPTDVDDALDYESKDICIECSHRILCNIYPTISS